MNSKDQKALAQTLILDELFDLSLYQNLEKITSGSLQATLQELIPIEKKHVSFWQDFFKTKLEKLNFNRVLKLKIITSICRIFGDKAVFLILESTEIYGIRKYLNIWTIYKDTPLAEGIKTILEDEFGHEDKIVSNFSERKINPEKIRNIFLGFNDGLVEFMGAVSGFYAAFQDSATVLIASFTGAAAGAISMAVGQFLATSSEKEILQTDLEKKHFLSGSQSDPDTGDHPFFSALVVGISYLFGAMFPILPILFGSKSVALSWASGGAAIILISLVLATISGMNIKKRVFLNLIMISLAIIISYTFGVLVNKFLGV
ncbi:MAG: hypothetical protein A3I11_01750 [Elusimicrobia bacterium RIFCSPLOWO2_02_FULL_39_32]|nr:MAG: hypothetical protein A2034_04475 [Elusimicrobia bacterium GWA2_38_7]OGR78260.1 MAG: hypothetical protein A3B80_06235 [Elusimicrobia bacterium RIFCSPHIGHO2_02_FULL_39_36]OGR92398.1 MAG: hypothetical protein A3I11_01750 [Elusimicrobia bacterium RIFCSPLOWO2_02_FULL_39_32]OGR98941.1 MAG: hypothetical protein A3G85_04055 [Elusimicrobia bacterium RIFCSPLOWO2_12_FULL_39_28]